MGKGKGAVVVQRVEQETASCVTFSSEDGGSVSISGAESACERAWKLILFLKGALPQILSRLRAGVSAGEFKSRPELEGVVEPHEVWRFAVDEAVWLFKNQ